MDKQYIKDIKRTWKRDYVTYPRWKSLIGFDMTNDSVKPFIRLQRSPTSPNIFLCVSVILESMGPPHHLCSITETLGRWSIILVCFFSLSISLLDVVVTRVACELNVHGNDNIRGTIIISYLTCRTEHPAVSTSFLTSSTWASTDSKKWERNHQPSFISVRPSRHIRESFSMTLAVKLSVNGTLVLKVIRLVKASTHLRSSGGSVFAAQILLKYPGGCSVYLSVRDSLSF
eukprot:Tbor_TRINITY_DN5723_c4_g3::TRINITY_DN5723_c4_g3_i1::g.20550::m.20550